VASWVADTLNEIVSEWWPVAPPGGRPPRFPWTDNAERHGGSLTVASSEIGHSIGLTFLCPRKTDEWLPEAAFKARIQHATHRT
jgi:hypothetical protein